jgi:hypothetical protein
VGKPKVFPKDCEKLGEKKRRKKGTGEFSLPPGYHYMKGPTIYATHIRKPGREFFCNPFLYSTRQIG